MILANAVDIGWTALGTHGGGPISGPVMAAIWKLHLRLHERRPNHRRLSFAGSLMLAGLLMLWTALLWLGWFCVFSAREGAIVNTQTQRPADAVSRLYFVAYAISTMGNGDFQPRSDVWRFLVAIATIGGIGTLTLSITFLLNVLPAVVAARQIGAYVTDLGETPQGIMIRAWTGEKFDGLHDHLIELTGMIHLYTEQHLAYPLLHYFHSEKERTASTLKLAVLNEVVFLLHCGIPEHVRLGPMAVLPVKDALRGLSEVMSAEFVEPADEAPPIPDLNMLREAGLPTVSDADFAEAAHRYEESRRFFAGLLADDGWPWERVYSRRS